MEASMSGVIGNSITPFIYSTENTKYHKWLYNSPGTQHQRSIRNAAPIVYRAA
jgi:hypothetical protein